MWVTSRYMWDKGDNYSPPIDVAVNGLSVPNSDPLYIQLVVNDGARNLQIPLVPDVGLSAKITWAPKPKRFSHSEFFHPEHGAADL
jgi:hypothetical protein